VKHEFHARNIQTVTGR